MASSNQTNDNMEIKTFDLNDADVTEENGCWVFRFHEKPETRKKRKYGLNVETRFWFSKTKTRQSHG